MSSIIDVAGRDPVASEHLLGMTRIALIITSVGPDFGAVGGSDDLRRIIGALLSYGLLVAVLMVIVCGSTWAIGSANGSWQTAAKAKTGLLIAIFGAVLTGGALAWANWLLDVGASL